MTRKTVFLILGLVVLAAVSASIYWVFAQPEPSQPGYIRSDSVVDPLQKVADLKVVNTPVEPPKLSSPEGDKSLQLVPTEDRGDVFIIPEDEQAIPVDQVIQGNWVSEDAILIVFGHVETISPSLSNPVMKTQVTGEKGIYLYNLKTEEKKLIFTIEGESSTFSAEAKDGFIIVCTGFSIEKLDMQGNFIKTLYKHTNQKENIFLTTQREVPVGQLNFSINTGTSVEKRTINLS